MITRNFIYSYPEPTADEIDEVITVIDKTSIKAAPSYSISGNLIKLNVYHPPVSRNIWSFIKGTLKKVIGAGKIF